ncbi:MAG: hypothetical protein A2Y66_00955 [Nitrospirae bacterium RBG_13_41_22]|nr:MAG: hypothetical protein A2Y66_00955 [Nitrospirae bacterium RBG_13_41_22]
MEQVKRYIEFIILFAFVLIYGLATCERNIVWKDDFTLWSDVVRKSPNKARPRSNLGLAYYRNKEFFQATEQFKKALSLNPDFSYARFNLGTVYQSMRLYDKAITEYTKALYTPREPFFYHIHNNLGVCYFIKGWTDMAIEEFRQAIEMNPYFSDARFNLSIAYSSKGLHTLAAEQMKKAEVLEKGIQQ